MLRNALIGLGSNLNSPIQQLLAAINSLQLQKDIDLIKVSSFYQSQPQGPQDQGLFINAVVLIQTALDPGSLLLLLQSIERQQGKVKVRHWGERCIDLDILFIDQLRIKLAKPALELPHPHALSRDFVLVPALEIAPEWILPDQTQLKEHLSTCLKHGLKKLPTKLESS